MDLLERLINKLRHQRFTVGQASYDLQARVVLDRPHMLEVDKWKTSAYLLKLVKAVGFHPFPLDELMLMAAAFEYHRPEIIIDIGTHLGKSARIWFELSQRLRLRTQIHTIDLCDAGHIESPGEALGRYIRGLPVRQHVGDGYSCACDIISSASPTAVFLLFLDGDHAYQSVHRELQLGRMIKRGCILVHDTFYQPGSTYNHGPYLAIQDSLSYLPVRQVIHLQTGLPGMSYLGLEQRVSG